MIEFPGHRMIPRILFVFCLLALSPGLLPVGAGTAPDPSGELSALLEERNVDIRWDPVFRRITFFRSGTSLSFLEGQTWCIKDGTRVLPGGDVPLDLADPRGMKEVTRILKEEFPPVVTEANSMAIRTIFIDPGHGGKDPGAMGRFKVGEKWVTLNEKDVVLDVGRMLSDMLRERYPGKKIVMSRDNDRYLPLDERTRIANKYASRNDRTIFVSLHANASLTPSARGYEVWYLPAEYRRQLIMEEEYSYLDKSLLPLLNSMVEEGVSVESHILAQGILSGLKDALGDRSLNRGLKQEEWYVVRNARMPSVLVEVGFVTNKDEHALLSDHAYLRKLTTGIYNGLVSFMEDYEKTPSGGKR